MALNIPFINDPLPRNFVKILNLEASQLSLPESKELMQGALAAYALLQIAAQSFNKTFPVAIFYGVASAAVLFGRSCCCATSSRKTNSSRL